MAIVKANYQPRAKTGAIGRSVAYYAWRDGADHPRETPRTWHAADGRALDFDQARAEIAGEAKDAAYTYRVVLSTRDVELEADDYREVLDGHFERWYFTEHHGAEHPHAHAIAFSDHRLDAGELRNMRTELLTHERAREQEYEREQEIAPAQERPERAERGQDGREAADEDRSW